MERVLPLGMYYTAIFAFIEQRSHLDYGLVNHALCAAIREMLRVRACGITLYRLYTQVLSIGLSNPPLPTRTRLQHLIFFLPPKTLVLRPPNRAHPIFNLPTHP